MDRSPPLSCARTHMHTRNGCALDVVVALCCHEGCQLGEEGEGEEGERGEKEREGVENTCMNDCCYDCMHVGWDGRS